jgi:hypothetical protein
MRFTDSTGRELTDDEIKAAGFGHLLDDAPCLKCPRCGRTTYDQTVRGKVCAMIRPSGTLCMGRFPE